MLIKNKGELVKIIVKYKDKNVNQNTLHSTFYDLSPRNIFPAETYSRPYGKSVVDARFA
jgi:hypothetical protein